MAQSCTICTHEKQAEIETALVAGTSYRDIARRFGVSKDAVARHGASHISQAVKQSEAAKQEAQALDVVKQLREINDVARAVMREALASKKNGTALFAIDRIQKQLELQAKLLGDIDNAPSVNVWLPASWSSIEQAIADALKAYPEASTAVASALMALDEGGHVKLN